MENSGAHAACNSAVQKSTVESIWSWFKAKFFPFHIILGYVFVVSGLIVCFLMLLTYIFVWPFSQRLYRKIVINLVYTHWCQFTFLGQWWSGSNCTMHIDDESVLQMIGQEHVIVLMNHKYDIDWLMAWILAERLNMLGGTKIYGKSSLKWVPLIGWAWMFTESIFLKRDWDKDKEIISRDLKYIRDYPDGYWVTLLLFCEGTRFTASKHAASMEVAKKKGLPLLKHHLLPRTKGFVHSVNGLKGKVPAILDLTVGFMPGSAEPTLLNIIQGKKCMAQMFARRIPLDSVPTDTDEACADWLQQHYREKDEIFENFFQNGEFTMGTKHDIPRRINDLVIWFIWTVVLCVPLFYYATGIFLAGSLMLKLVICATVVIGYIGVRLMIAVTEIRTSSSEYGHDKKQS
jgi:lysophosphatidic acid acyltransferase/lysophosphatidylinositol acyltransferase